MRKLLCYISFGFILFLLTSCIQPLNTNPSWRDVTYHVSFPLRDYYEWTGTIDTIQYTNSDGTLVTLNDVPISSVTDPHYGATNPGWNITLEFDEYFPVEFIVTDTIDPILSGTVTGVNGLNDTLEDLSQDFDGLDIEDPTDDSIRGGFYVVVNGVFDPNNWFIVSYTETEIEVSDVTGIVPGDTYEVYPNLLTMTGIYGQDEEGRSVAYSNKYNTIDNIVVDFNFKGEVY